MRRLDRLLLCAIILLTGCAGSGVATTSRDTAPPAPTTTTAAPTTAAAPASTTTTVPAWSTETLRPAGNPTALAAELAEVETGLHDPRTSADLLALDAVREQAAYELLAIRPTWLAAVLAHLPAPWRATVQANTAAATELRALSSPATELPSWQVTPPASSPATLLAYYKEAEAATGVPWEILAAIHLVESKMSRLRSDSSAGAQGPMQFLPATWAAYGHGNVDDDHDAILGAADYLRAMGAPGDLTGALFHYNNSDDYVQAVMTYADQMRTDPSAFGDYYHWQVLYLLGGGEYVLPEGFPRLGAIRVG